MDPKLVTGTCVTRDAGGVCCASNHVDTCGVCDGDHNSCAIAATVAMGLPDTYDEAQVTKKGSDQYISFSDQFCTDVAHSMPDVTKDQCEVTSIDKVDVGARRVRRLTAGVNGITVAFNILPPANMTGQPSMTHIQAQLVSKITTPTSTFYNGVLTRETVPTSLTVTRSGKCGNNKCEIGEDYTNCRADCTRSLVPKKKTSSKDFAAWEIAVGVIIAVVVVAGIAVGIWSVTCRNTKPKKRSGAMDSKTETELGRMWQPNPIDGRAAKSLEGAHARI
jgi:hypothetical protein